MKEISDERMLGIYKARRKGRHGADQTEFEIGVGYLVNTDEEPTGQVVIRTEQLDSGVAPIVAVLEISTADDFCTKLIDAIGMAEIGEGRKKTPESNAGESPGLMMAESAAQRPN